MENIETTQKTEPNIIEKNYGPIVIASVTVILLILAIWQFSMDKEEVEVIVPEDTTIEAVSEVLAEPEVSDDPIFDTITVESIAEPTVESLALSEPKIIEAPVTVVLPNIDDSDEYIKNKLPELTWRNELLSLLITDDIIRRFVVFTDNFSQGLLAYEHSPFVKPKSKFSINESTGPIAGQKNVWHWDAKTSLRFDRYVDLLRSVDSSTLVDLYFESKPLIDEAYSELGYEDDFTNTLQDAIIKVLDMELPQSSMDITRSSVMYKYKGAQLESLTDSDKLLLRIGKENLLIIKSVLLEINEKLIARVNKG